MKVLRWVMFGITILSGAACLLEKLLPWFVARFALGGQTAAGSAASIGIIGGADGPTAIFVASSRVPNYLMPIVFAASLFTWLFLRAKRNSQ